HSKNMKQEILSNLGNPGQLEKLYRTDKSNFKRTFKILYPEIKDNPLVGFWNERLNFSGEEISWGTRKELVFVIIGALIAGIIAKLPAILSIDEEFFYLRNIGFIIFPVLAAYFAWKNNLSKSKIIFIVGAFLASLVFINSLPAANTSDTLILSCIHLVLFLWAIMGFAFVGEIKNEHERKLAYLKFNGDLIVMTTLIVVAGGIL